MSNIQLLEIDRRSTRSLPTPAVPLNKNKSVSFGCKVSAVLFNSKIYSIRARYKIRGSGLFLFFTL